MRSDSKGANVGSYPRPRSVDDAENVGSGSLSSPCRTRSKEAFEDVGKTSLDMCLYPSRKGIFVEAIRGLYSKLRAVKVHDSSLYES